MEYEKAPICIRDAVFAAFPEAPLREPRLMSPLVLAYIGDTVYDLYVRTHIINTSDATVHGLHLKAANRVCAAAQASAYRRIESLLDETELAIYKRGRNAHMGTVPKHASIADYRAATGFETLVGYLYLCGNDARISSLMRVALKENTEG